LLIQPDKPRTSIRHTLVDIYPTTCGKILRCLLNLSVSVSAVSMWCTAALT
jgi:hypothetical protein